MKFFESLPNLSIAAPNAAGDHPLVGLIPVFNDPYFPDMFSAYLKSAIYSRQTWLLHTDAYAQNVAIKLYIEDTLLPVATPLLENNKLNLETDVLWFTAPPLIDTLRGVWGRLGKKLRLYWDPQLAHYEKIVYWDADLFKVPEPEFQDFFTRAADEPYFSFTDLTTLKRREWRPSMIRSATRNVHLGRLPLQDIYANAGLGRVLQEIKGHLTRPTGSLCIYPAATFRDESPESLTWIRDHGPYIGEDEHVIGLAAAKFVFYLSSLRTWDLRVPHVNLYLSETSVNEPSDDAGHVCAIHGCPIPDYEAHYRDLIGVAATA